MRENILFGEPYDEDRYCQVLFQCALESDLEILPDGDLTSVGEKVRSFLLLSSVTSSFAI